MREPDRTKPTIREEAWKWAVSVEEMVWVAARILVMKDRAKRLCPSREASRRLAQMGIDLAPSQIQMIYKRGKVYTEKEKRLISGQMRWVRLVDPKELAHYFSLTRGQRVAHRPWLPEGCLEEYKWNTTVGMRKAKAGYD